MYTQDILLMLFLYQLLNKKKVYLAICKYLGP